ncbi:SRR1-like protein [Oppia nitens]|uniref:SRR1-like protein n=1 Tax=Oppia nitens TaxID=1686743 RepID=UPI0023DC3787|nr:SRR1-like protein [Oppia nitens]
MSLINETNDGFISVYQTRRRKNRNRYKYQSNELSFKLSTNLKHISTQMVDSRTLINVLTYVSNICLITNKTLIINKISHIVCYGLGNFLTSIDSLYQLALLVSLKKSFAKSLKISIFDPIFSDIETDFLKNNLQFNVLKVNNHCIHSIDIQLDQMVMFYMPHCDKCLFNNLLWSNWTLSQLNQMVILGNSFNTMIETIGSQRVAKHEFKYLFATTLCEEFKIC